MAGPTVGRELAEQGADVLGATRPNDFEHDWVYFEAIGSRSAWLDLTKDTGRANVDRLLRDAHVVVNNHRDLKLEKLGIDPHNSRARTLGWCMFRSPATDPPGRGRTGAAST